MGAAAVHDSVQPTLMLVDGYGLIFRAYHALPPTLATSAGEQVNAVFGFASMLLDVIGSQRPDYAVVALEGGRTFRHDAFDGYKAHRAEMPDDLRQQVDRVQQLITALNIPIERRDGYEADDVIGSIATQTAREGELRTLIVTGDTDLLQLVDDHVEVVLPGTRRFGELRVFDRAAVHERYGFGPELIADYKALVGDTSDNIPGVPGIGDKTAKALIARFGGIADILAGIAEVTPRRAQAALEANAARAVASKHLASIVRDLDIPVELGRSAVGNYDREQVVSLFRELEFRSLMARLPEPAPQPRRPPPTRQPTNRTIVRDLPALRQIVDQIAASGHYAVDVESTSTDPLTARLVGIAIAADSTQSAYIPVAHQEGQQLQDHAVREVLAPVFIDPQLTGYAHHAKYDLHLLRRHGYELTNLGFDSMIAAYLLSESSVRLKDLAFTRLGVEMTEITALIGTGRQQLTMDRVGCDEAGVYACADVEATLALADLLSTELKAQHQDKLFEEIEMPLVPVLVAMEALGIAIDSDYLAELSAEITQRSKALEREIFALAGRELNINSTKQLATLLFDELKLPAGRRTKTGYSVDSDMLETIRLAHPIVDLILEYRSLGKLKSTYVDSLPLQVNADTGRVHTSFNQTVAATGRLSSTNPNLQNIPIRTELGRRVRRAFIADRRPTSRLFEDAVLLSADYSQIELRLLAHMSNEPFLVEAFRRGEDIHRATAALVAGVAPDQVTPDMRRVAKTVNFGVLYGMQSYGLSRDTGLSRAEAQQFIDQYWERLPGVKRVFNETLRFGAIHGYVETLSGRRRYLPDLLSPNGARRIGAERMAINMPVQGTAADIMKMAMIHVDHALQSRALRARMLLQVHDELVLEVERADLEQTAELVVETMEAAYDLSVPLVAEVQAGDNWDELVPLELASTAHRRA